MWWCGGAYWLCVLGGVRVGREIERRVKALERDDVIVDVCVPVPRRRFGSVDALFLTVSRVIRVVYICMCVCVGVRCLHVQTSREGISVRVLYNICRTQKNTHHCVDWKYTKAHPPPVISPRKPIHPSDTCTPPCTHTKWHSYNHTHTHMHIYIHTHTHIHIYTRTRSQATQLPAVL